VYIVFRAEDAEPGSKENKMIHGPFRIKYCTQTQGYHYAKDGLLLSARELSTFGAPAAYLEFLKEAQEAKEAAQEAAQA
jgi:hypothetical protein